MITIMADNKPIKVDWLEFSDGALTCKIDIPEWDIENYVAFHVCPTTPVKQVMEEVDLALNAILNVWDWNEGIKLILGLPYLPYGRAERIFEKGNPNPLDVFLNNVYAWGFDEIIINDPHNPESLRNEKNITIIPQLNCFINSVMKHDFDPKKSKVWDYVIAPDKGAKDKAKTIAEWLGVPLLQADKKRDVSTGRIIETELDTQLPVGSHVIIVDDILDGGGTFIPLAEKITSQGATVDLYVTHLIGAKGLDIFKGLINNIYCYQCVGKHTNITNIMNFNQGK